MLGFSRIRFTMAMGVLAVAMLLQLGIVAAMAFAASPAVLALVCLRNFPMALVHAPVRAAIAPRIERRQRATYLSLQGLAERLFFALLLLLLASELEPGAPIATATLTSILTSTVAIGCGRLSESRIKWVSVLR